MTEPHIKLRLDQHDRTYLPGEHLAGQFSLEGVPADDVRAIEVSVLWHTQGKGDEDMSVHFFERIDARNGHAGDFREPHRFSTTLPNSPLSYRGLIVMICWRVRVRVFLARGKELLVELPLQLGTVPVAQEANA
jgi:hypothetical protein